MKSDLCFNKAVIESHSNIEAWITHITLGAYVHTCVWQGNTHAHTQRQAPTLMRGSYGVTAGNAFIIQTWGAGWHNTFTSTLACVHEYTGAWRSQTQQQPQSTGSQHTPAVGNRTLPPGLLFWNVALRHWSEVQGSSQIKDNQVFMDESSYPLFAQSNVT